MSEDLTKEEKINASKLLLSGFLTQIIGGGSTYLIVLVVGLADPFLAAFLVILVYSAATLGAGFLMLWLGNPNNIYWRKAKQTYEDAKDGSLDENKESIIIKQQIATKTEAESHVENLKQLSESLAGKEEFAEDKEVVNGEIKTIKEALKKEE